MRKIWSRKWSKGTEEKPILYYKSIRKKFPKVARWTLFQFIFHQIRWPKPNQSNVDNRKDDRKYFWSWCFPSQASLSRILEPSKFPILQFLETCFECLQLPWPEYNFHQTDFNIFGNFNIYVKSAANLVYVERVLSEKLQIRLCLFFLLVKMADMGHSKMSIVFLIIKPKLL